MKALRSLPRTDNPQILAALLRRMTDGYGYYRHEALSYVAPEQVLVTEARWYAIPWQGKKAIGPVIDWMKQGPEDYARGNYGPEILGKLGSDPRSLALLGQRVSIGSHDERCAIVPALGRLGRDAVPILVKIAADGEQNGIIRRLAIEEMRQHSDAKTVGPTLLAMMQETDPQLVYAAIQTAEVVRLREALPVFKRLALDEKTEQNARSWAICAYARMADRKEAEPLLLGLLQSPSTSAAGNAAHMLATLECRAAVPRLLDLLSHTDWYVRAKADEALRGLAKKPEGVGYDARKPDPAAWRKWWGDKR
jgi:HEAT repeat protein